MGEACPTPYMSMSGRFSGRAIAPAIAPVVMLQLLRAHNLSSLPLPSATDIVQHTGYKQSVTRTSVGTACGARIFTFGQNRMVSGSTPV
jgi:hypothetical protein